MLPAVLLSLILGGMLVLMVENEPKLHGRADLTPERIAHGKRVFEQNDPRRLKAGAITEVSLDEQDLDLAINYFTNQYLGGVAGLEVDSGRARIEATLKLPDYPLGRFLNLEIEFEQTDRLPRFDHALLGKLWVPGWLAESVIEKSIAAVQPVDWQVLAAMIRQVRFEPRRMRVTYRWQDDLPGKLGGVFWSAQDQKRLEFYQRHLVELTQGSRDSLNLTVLLNPLFQLAKDRSDNGKAVAENRALILVLAFYVNRKDLHKLIPSSKAWPRPIWRNVNLNGRGDFTKHYLVSAMLAAYAGTPLADVVGLYKEIEDARGGSGFSFNDIAADRAGTRMGELATNSESWAKKIQRLMADAKESDMMPATADLPEFMPRAEFIRRFGGLEGGKYRQMMADIERRVAALAINRDE
ncbi:MAG: hypothetical protein LUQ11_05805 [Methylococcaceae bacterium]|nr:hypothetical protein [Methylococcaceae bacterium]